MNNILQSFLDAFKAILGIKTNQLESTELPTPPLQQPVTQQSKLNTLTLQMQDNEINNKVVNPIEETPSIDKILEAEPTVSVKPEQSIEPAEGINTTHTSNSLNSNFGTTPVATPEQTTTIAQEPEVTPTPTNTLE